MRPISIFISAVALGLCALILGHHSDRAIKFSHADQAWAEAIWASLLVNPDDESTVADEAFDRAIRQSKWKAPVFVAMVGAVSGPKKAGEMMNRFVVEYLRSARADEQVNKNHSELAKIVRRETSDVEAAYLAAVADDPTYKPAWYELVKSSDRAISHEALAALNRLDPDNALLDFLQAADTINHQGADAALDHIQAGNVKSACRAYPNLLPTRFSLRYPDSESFRMHGVVGRPISPSAFAYLVNIEAKLWSWSDQEIPHRLRILSRLVIELSESRIQEDDLDRAEVMLLALRTMGNRLLLEESSDLSLAIVGLFFISMANDSLIDLYCRNSREKSCSLEHEIAHFRRSHQKLMLTFDQIKPTDNDIRAFLLGTRDHLAEERAAFRVALQEFVIK